MNRLWVRLSIAFGVVVFVGSVAIITLSTFIAQLELTPLPFLNALRDGLKKREGKSSKLVQREVTKQPKVTTRSVTSVPQK